MVIVAQEVVDTCVVGDGSARRVLAVCRQIPAKLLLAHKPVTRYAVTRYVMSYAYGTGS